MIFRFVQKISLNIILYLALLAFFEANRDIFNTSGIVSQNLDLSKYTQEKSKKLINQLEHQNLAVNFLTNQRTLNEEEKIAFQSSGLVHLLAVSGAQIIPVCQILSFCVMQIFYFCFRKHFSSSHLMKIIFYLKSFVIISTSFLMTGLFSCAGALIRVTFLSSLNEFFKSQKHLYYVSRLIPMFSDSFVRRFLLLFLMSLLFGNIFLDYSFLLSSLGALTLEISSLFLNFFLKKIQMKSGLRKIMQPILLSLLTSFSVSILLFPVSRVSFVLSSFSNIFASPLVTFLITPLSLILLLFPSNLFWQHWILSLFDRSLGILNFIAEIFQDADYSLQIPKILLFSYEGKFYLIVLLIVLFSIIDAIRSRDEEHLRHFFQKKSGSEKIKTIQS